jgi:V8-like Glu-specific endopeptidase
MTEIIVVPNGNWKPFGLNLPFFQSGGVVELPLGSKKFDMDLSTNKFTDEELAAILEARVEASIALQSDVQNNLILGSSDFLPFAFFDKGRTAGKAVCCLWRQFNDSELDEIIKLAKQDARIRARAIKWFVDENSPIDPANVNDEKEFRKQAKTKKVPCATGFLVGKSYILTNLHVVDDISKLLGLSAAFGYEGESDLTNATSYLFDTKFWKSAKNLSLDYVLLKLAEEVDEKFPPISLNALDLVQICPRFSVQDINSLHETGNLKTTTWETLQENGIRGDSVNLIQHPEGRSKEIVIFNNQLDTLYKDFLGYTSDALPGSSGSPLFNEHWELIGLHQAALLNVEGKRVTGYLGIRMSSILADLQSQSDTEIQAFLESLNPAPVVKTTQQVFILAGRDRSPILKKPDDAILEQDAMLQLQDQIEVALKRLNPAIAVIKIKASEKNLAQPESYKKPVGLDSAIQNIIDEAAKSTTTQNVAIELLTDAYDKDNVSGFSLYYNGRDENGKSYAKTLLNNIIGVIKEKSEDLPFFGVGAYSDIVTKPSRLAFCRRLNMPALVFYAGYLTNPNDLKNVQSLLNAETSSLAEGIAAGLADYFAGQISTSQ